MREKAILFSDEMVRAIIDGAKTQTRRLVKPQPVIVGRPGSVKDIAWPGLGVSHTLTSVQSNAPSWFMVHCPYGKSGDRLWVRETWGDMALEGYEPVYAYRADPEGEEGWGLPPGFKWHRSIFMPRAASRITLEVTDIRVERLQAISEEDAEAEGFTGDHRADRDIDAAQEYRALWDKINGKRASWESNPWVWVIGFRRILNDLAARQEMERIYFAAVDA